MSITVIGASAMVEQPTERTWTKEGQLIITRVFKGPPITSLVTDKETEMRTLGADRVTSSIGKSAMVRADFTDQTAISSAPGGGVASDPDADAVTNSTWELIGNDLDKALALHPAFQGAEAPMAIEAIERDLQNHASSGGGYDTSYPAAGGHMDDYNLLRIVGTESYLTFSYIVRNVIQSPRASTFKLATTPAAGQVIAWSAIGIPAGAKFGQPQFAQWNGTANTNTAINQWLVKAPQCRWNGKLYELTREWWGAVAWSAVLYSGGAGTP